MVGDAVALVSVLIVSIVYCGRYRVNFDWNVFELHDCKRFKVKIFQRKVSFSGSEILVFGENNLINKSDIV